MTEDKSEEGTDSTSEGGGFNLGELRKLIREEIGAAKKNSDDVHETASSVTERRLDRGSRVQDEVREELAKLKTKEDEEREKAGLLERLGKLEEHLTEKPPVERRRVHKFMGWGE